MFRVLLPLLLVCASALRPGVAAAAEPEGLTPLRQELRAARDTLGPLYEQQAAAREELNRVSARVDGLKGKRGLLERRQLNEALQESQAVSQRLAQLSRMIAMAQARVQERGATLAEALTKALAEDRARWVQQVDRTQRLTLLEEMRRLRTEREAVTQGLAAGKDTAAARIPAAGGEATSEDPVELLAQADALRDAEDKLHRELKTVETRLAEAEDERRLSARMGAFSREEDLFDEQVRSLRLNRDANGEYSLRGTSSSSGVGFGASLSPGTTSGSPGGAAAPGTASGPATGGGTNTGAGGSASGSGAGGGAAGGGSSAGGGGPLASASQPPSAGAPQAAVDRHPQVNGVASPAGPGISEDSPAALAARKRKLEGLLRELEQRARAAESRARALQ